MFITHYGIFFPTLSGAERKEQTQIKQDAADRNQDALRLTCRFQKILICKSYI